MQDAFFASHRLITSSASQISVGTWAAKDVDGSSSLKNRNKTSAIAMLAAQSDCWTTREAVDSKSFSDALNVDAELQENSINRFSIFNVSIAFHVVTV